jgi:hypothetical protein
VPEAPPSTGLTRFTPEVRTLAKPSAGPLVAARGVVQRSPALRDLMHQAKVGGMSPDHLAGLMVPELERQLECEPEAAVEVAQYLADEFFQLGDAVLICDRATGKAIARVTDEDMYQPPRQERMSGRMADPLPRLNPNLEGFLVSYIFEEARDRELVAAIQARLPSTGFLQGIGDPRLRPLTRGGRVGIAQDIRDALPTVLEAVQGACRTFLGYFVVDHHGGHNEALDVGEFSALPRRTAEARGRQNVVDPKAMNLRFSWEATLRARTGTAWAREMASHLVEQARTHVPAHMNRGVVTYPLLTSEHVSGIPFWTGDAAACLAIQRIVSEGVRVSAHVQPTVLPCPSEQGCVGFQERAVVGPVGYIVIHPEAYSFETREAHGRWEMNAKMDYTIYVAWNRVTYLRVTDIPVEAVAEIL